MLFVDEGSCHFVPKCVQEVTSEAGLEVVIIESVCNISWSLGCHILACHRWFELTPMVASGARHSGTVWNHGVEDDFSSGEAPAGTHFSLERV